MAKAKLTDAYRYDVPDSEKTEKPPAAVSANFTPALPGSNKPPTVPKRKREDGPPTKRKRRSFPRGSCKNCPDSTTHTTKFCYKDKRLQKGLPISEQWCTVHTESAHWDSECRRHPHNRKKRKHFNKAALVQAEVTKQITALIGSTEAPRVSITKKFPPRSARLLLSNQEPNGPSPIRISSPITHPQHTDNRHSFSLRWILLDAQTFHIFP